MAANTMVMEGRMALPSSVRGATSAPEQRVMRTTKNDDVQQKPKVAKVCATLEDDHPKLMLG
jgi:hypothetical protein